MEKIARKITRYLEKGIPDAKVEYRHEGPATSHEFLVRRPHYSTPVSFSDEAFRNRSADELIHSLDALKACEEIINRTWPAEAIISTRGIR